VITAAIALLASLSALAAFIAAQFSHGHWTLDLVSQFLLPATAGAALAVVLASVSDLLRDGRRHRGALWGVFALSVWFLPTLAPRGLPPFPLTPDAAPVLSVRQHNVLYSNETPEAVAASISARDDDIIALQEAQRRRFAPVLEPVEAELGYFVSADAPGERRQTGMRVLAKSPVLSREILRTETGASLVVTKLDTPDAPLTVIAVHLTRPYPFDHPLAQMRQVEELIGFYREADCPCLILGDFNSAPWGRVAKRLRTEGLLQVPIGARGTWPVWLPQRLGIPIDLAFVSPGVAVGEVEVLEAWGSDHRSVAFSIFVAPPVY
jgi:endonuclease/exonuclease/phosphatase (EEP) superfamily protein YafD